MRTSKNPMIDENGEVRELTNSDFKHARKASDVFPGALQAKLGMLGSKHKEAEKKSPPRVSKSVDSVADWYQSSFSKFADVARQKYVDDIKMAMDRLALNIEGVLVGDIEHIYESHASKYLAHHIKLKVYDQLVHLAVEKFSKHSDSDDEAILTWLAAVDAPARPSQGRLERMGKSRLTELVKIQSEMLENFKVLFTLASGGSLEGGDLERSVLSDEIERAGVAKILRKLAEEVEATELHSRSRA